MERGDINFGEYADPIRGCITAALTGTSTYGQSGSLNKTIWGYQSFRPFRGTGRVDLMLLDADMRFRHDLYFRCPTFDELQWTV